MRLDKFICHNTDISRSEVKKIMHKGLVTVNKTIQKNPGTILKENDLVELKGQQVSAIPTRYIMLNKPEGYVCTSVDDDARSVFNLITCPKRDALHTAGRLDADTTGLVLITDDGQWSHRITAPRSKCVKTYVVQLDREITPDMVQSLEQGVVLNDSPEPTRPAKINIISTHNIELTICEGRYHQVRRMLAAVGNHVTGLHRQQIGNISLDTTLNPGEWRYLSDEEALNI